MRARTLALPILLLAAALAGCLDPADPADFDFTTLDIPADPTYTSKVEPTPSNREAIRDATNFTSGDSTWILELVGITAFAKDSPVPLTLRLHKLGGTFVAVPAAVEINVTRLDAKGEPVPGGNFTTRAPVSVEGGREPIIVLREKRLDVDMANPARAESGGFDVEVTTWLEIADSSKGSKGWTFTDQEQVTLRERVFVASGTATGG